MSLRLFIMTSPMGWQSRDSSFLWESQCCRFLEFAWENVDFDDCWCLVCFIPRRVLISRIPFRCWWTHSKYVIKCGYCSGLSFTEVASAILPNPFLLMPMGTIKARAIRFAKASRTFHTRVATCLCRNCVCDAPVTLHSGGHLAVPPWLLYV